MARQPKHLPTDDAEFRAARLAELRRLAEHADQLLLARVYDKLLAPVAHDAAVDDDRDVAA